MKYYKTTFTEGEREKDAHKGYAMPDGSYPIENVEDLHHAIRAFGRAKNPEATKRHIMTRARELGKESMLPEDWGHNSKSFDGIYKSYKQLMSVMPVNVYVKSTISNANLQLMMETKAEKEGLEGLAEEKFHSPHGAMIRSLIAHKASMESDKPSRLSRDALDAAKDGMNNFASRLHRAASVHHAKQARDAGNFIERSAHEHAAQAHDTAADHHIAAHLRLGKPLELTDYSEYEEKAIIQELDNYYDQRFIKADEDEGWISDKIAKIMREGITLRNGKHKKVTNNKQAAAIAYSMHERGKKAYDGDAHEKTVGAYHKTIESPYGRDMDEHAHDTLRHSHEGRNVAAALGHSQMFHDHNKAAEVIKEAEIAEHHKHAAAEHKEAALAHLGHAILCLAGKCDKSYSNTHSVEPKLHHNEEM